MIAGTQVRNIAKSSFSTNFIDKRMQKKINFLYVFCSPIPACNREFAVHVPLRLKKQFGELLDLYVLFSGELNTDQLQKEGINCHQFTTNKILHWLILMISLRRLVSLKEIHIISNVWRHYLIFLLKIGCWGTRGKIIARVSGDPTNIRQSPAWFTFRWWARRVGRIFERYSFHIADGIHFVSHSLQTTFIMRYPSLLRMKSKIISQGIDTNAFTFSRPNYVRPRKLIFVGRIEPNKGIKELFRAFDRVSVKYPDMTLTLVGPGDLSVVPTEIAKKVFYLGVIEHEKLPEVYKNYDILLLPSYSEGLPNTVLEAMASGLAVIASGVGDIPSLLDEGRGLIINPKDVDELCSAIESVATSQNSDILKMLGLARDHVEKHHSFEATRSNYLIFWRNEIGIIIPENLSN